MKKILLPVNFILLCLYVIYAISPLTYDSINCRHQGEVRGPNGKDGRIVKLYVVDVIMSALTEDERDADDDASSSQNHILLGKKKALRTPVVKLITHLLILSTRRADLPCGPEDFAVAAPERGAAPTCPNGYECLHSGTSPPAA